MFPGFVRVVLGLDDLRPEGRAEKRHEGQEPRTGQAHAEQEEASGRVLLLAPAPDGDDPRPDDGPQHHQGDVDLQIERPKKSEAHGEPRLTKKRGAPAERAPKGLLCFRTFPTPEAGCRASADSGPGPVGGDCGSARCRTAAGARSWCRDAT